MPSLRQLGLALAFAGAIRAQAVNLGKAAPFAVLGASTVTNTGESIVTGDLGISPGKAITGFPPGKITGSTHTANAHALDAHTDLQAAYDVAAAKNSEPLEGDLAGLTIIPGVYSFSTTGALNGDLILDGLNNTESVWVFQTGSSLITGSGASVKLVNGASACNIFWQVGSSATLGSGTEFAGNILALSSITANTGATNVGGFYALGGAVTLNGNEVTKGAECVPKPTHQPCKLKRVKRVVRLRVSV